MAELRPEGSRLTMGHEGVGVIEKMHPSCEDKGFKVGDKIGKHTVLMKKPIGHR